MKISLECECVLLQNSLRLFLKDCVAHRKDCDFVISDKKLESKKPLFLISSNSAHLQIPFTKETLMNTLEEFYSAIQIPNANFAKPKFESLSLEQDIDTLVNKFKKDLIELIKQYR